MIDGPQSRVLDEAENRRHVQKALLATGALIMRGLQWHYDRLVDEFRAIARVTVTDLRSGGGRRGALTLTARRVRLTQPRSRRALLERSCGL